MMQDRKALQAGTSHFLGQNFARASNIRFQTADEVEQFVWTTSWGASTRLIGGVIMSHGDDDGLAVPPRVAPTHVAILPIAHKAEDRATVMDYCEQLASELRARMYHHRHLVVDIDDRDIGGARGWDWIKKGVPIRVEIGPRDVAAGAVFMARRDKGHREKTSMPRQQFVQAVGDVLDDIQSNLYQRAKVYRDAHTRIVDDRGDFYDFFTPENSDKPEIHGGFALSHWCGSEACESKIKEDLTVTIRCLPHGTEKEQGPCICCGAPSPQRVVFAKAY
jgi:prolyl-tRNA synthetase